MSRLRARCPDCGGLTAVALLPGYECHACGRAFAAAVVRIEPAPALALPWPDAGSGSPAELPDRPIVLAEEHEPVAAALGAALVRLAQSGLSPPERELPSAIEGVAGVYVVLDGPPPADAERLLALVRDLAPVLGAGLRDVDADEAVPLLRTLGL